MVFEMFFPLFMSKMGGKLLFIRWVVRFFDGWDLCVLIVMGGVVIWSFLDNKIRQYASF